MKFSTISNIFWILLVSIASIATASAETRQLNPKEHEEKYDMPPAYIFRLESSPRMISSFGPFTSYQANVDAAGNNIVGDAANEPSIAVDPTDSSKITIGWRQFNTVTSNFRQGGWGYTTDGGLHWTFPGVLENNVFRSDPVLDSNELGTFFYLSLRGDDFCDNIWQSTNGGQAWTSFPGTSGGDKQWFTVDKTGGPGHGFQYQFWTAFFPCSSGEFSRSTDGGMTWQSPINIPHGVIHGTPDVDTNGNLFIGGEDLNDVTFWCIRSSNAQIGNQTPVFEQVTQVNLGGVRVGGNVNPGGLTAQIFLAVDRSGGPTNNNVYMLCSVRPPSYSNGTDVMIARSTNGGASFSAPVRINDDATTNKWHWFGTFSVAPNGRLDAVWYDTRNATDNLQSQLFYSYSTDAGTTWSPNVPVSGSFNPREGWPQQNKIGDYITIVSDNTGGNVAYSATFNFNPSQGQHEQDVYYVRVSPTGGGTPTPTPTASPTPTATATASPTPTLTPTATPTATATFTPTATATATATATPTATATATPSSTATATPTATSNSYSQTDTDAKGSGDAESPSHTPAEAIGLTSPCPAAEVVVTALPAAPKYDEGGCRRAEANATNVKTRLRSATARQAQRGGYSKNLSVHFVDNTHKILSTTSRSSIKGSGPARRFEIADQGSRIASTVYASLAGRRLGEGGTTSTIQ